ncbi:hypothetical protein SAMN05660742_11614 [Propionispira arboris]|uniref:Transcriptional regulator n=1 Tax=Propionispira arboris TaxID=84035 RepID=A0A1H7BEB7_9FIRM|nr:hypothetical protein [Propionispira arboris]SEJ75274.1 hypothetical protein SAMN05660742_11614 [Propionispira arboris]
MQKIGVVSSSMKMIERIINVAKSMKVAMAVEWVSFPYTDIAEVSEILIANKNKVGGWIFSGPNPYTAAKPYLGKDDNAVFCGITGNEIFKCILEMACEKKSTKLKISMDCPTSDIFTNKESVNELKVAKEMVVFYEYNIPFVLDDIVKMHLSCWKSGEFDGIVTTLHAVELELKKNKVPVRRLMASTTSIRQAVRVLMEKLNGLYFKNSQVGLEIIEIKNFEKIIERAGDSYKLQMLELKIRERLLKLCQGINGYLSEKGNGRYEIFSSRGLLEQHVQVLQDMIDEVRIALATDIVAGIGFGATVFTAQLNAYRAVNQGKSIGSQGIVMIDDDGQIIEAAGQENELGYLVFSADKELLQQLTVANVGIKTYQKIVAIVKKMNWENFTSAMLAGQLEVTDRNVRRIMKDLLKVGLVECIGEEALASRGRPTKKYQLK